MFNLTRRSRLHRRRRSRLPDRKNIHVRKQMRALPYLHLHLLVVAVVVIIDRNCLCLFWSSAPRKQTETTS